MRRLAFVAFLAIAALSIDYRMLLGARVQPPADRWPDYPEFLNEVRRATKSGDTIVLLAPARRGTTDYQYAYFRASYFLAGREVLPAVDDQGEIVNANIANAKYVAVFHGQMPSHRPLIFRGHGGELRGR